MAARRIRPRSRWHPTACPVTWSVSSKRFARRGISVGPSETVDAGQVLGVLDLADREAVREGLACAVLRRSEHRQTYDAMFDLWWPAAPGGRTVVADDVPDVPDGQDPGIWRRCGPCCWTCSPRTPISVTWTSGWWR